MNVDQVIENAAARGAKVREPVANFVSGDRFGSILDPCGVRWSIMTKILIKKTAPKAPPQRSPKSMLGATSKNGFTLLLHNESQLYFYCMLSQHPEKLK